MKGVGCGRIDEVGGENSGDEDEWVDPGVSKGQIFPPAEEAAGFSTLEDAGDLGLRVALGEAVSIAGDGGARQHIRVTKAAKQLWA